MYLTKPMHRVGKEYNDFCIIIGKPEIGAGTWIGYFTLLDASGGLKIGRQCSISSGVQIYTHDSVRWSLENLEKDRVNYTHVDRAPVTIGDYVYIGANVIVTKGVTIGNRCVIGAGAVVTKSLPAQVVAIGVPARIVGRVTFDRRGKSRIIVTKSKRQ
jgi:acetyltransferase-like isoleucine patch superfamily enzyme